MTPRRLLAGLWLALAAPVLAQGGPAPGRDREESSQFRRAYANPSAAIAAEIALSRLAQEKGQWTAFRETAARDAVMFAPQMVLALPWLKNRPNPPAPLRRQPHRVWSSCDGSLMVTTGAWQRGGQNGWFTTVWERQEDGSYKWVFEHHAQVVKPLDEPDMIAASAAECPPRRRSVSGSDARPPARKRAKTPPVPFDPAAREGRSRDHSLEWRVTADGSGHEFTARFLRDGEMREFRQERVAASDS